jgi:hypothetical protein
VVRDGLVSQRRRSTRTTRAFGATPGSGIVAAVERTLLERIHNFLHTRGMINLPIGYFGCPRCDREEDRPLYLDE